MEQKDLVLTAENIGGRLSHIVSNSMGLYAGKLRAREYGFSLDQEMVDLCKDNFVKYLERDQQKFDTSVFGNGTIQKTLTREWTPDNFLEIFDTLSKLIDSI